jgi:hypothetical protein
VRAGTVGASVSLHQFQEQLTFRGLLSPGSGYGFIVTQKGIFVSHPIDSFVEDRRTLSDFDQSLDAGNIRVILRTSQEGVLRVDHVDEASGQESWAFFAPIASTDWLVGLVLAKDEVFRDSRITRRHRLLLVGVSLSVIAFLTFLSIPLFGAHTGASRRLWAVSITFSVLAIGGIGYLWFQNTTASSADNDRNIMLVDRATSAKVVADYSRGVSGPILVPTGVFVQSLEVVDANSILMTAIIWQTYSEGSPNWEVRPEPGSGTPILITKADVNYGGITELYRRRKGDQEVIGWYVRAVLNQQFDFSEFPFDREDIFVRMRHKDFDKGVILTPDLESYRTTGPDAIPGVERDEFFLEGWSIERSFFSFRENQYNTTFGFPGPLAQGSSPELYFNIGLSRRFLDPFISNVVPIAVVAILLFAVLVLFSARQERLGVLGFSASAVLGYCAALFFVVIFEHISLRSSLEAPQGIIYLEYIYFVTYGAILSVSVNAILFAAAPSIRFLQYRDNLVMDLLFWPTYLGLLLVFTLIAFL